MRFYYRRDDLPPTRAFRGLELLYDGQFIIIGQVLIGCNIIKLDPV